MHVDLSSQEWARYICEAQLVRDRPVVLGFLHPARGCRPGGTLFSSGGCWSCICMQGIPIGGLAPIVAVWCWLCVRPPGNQQSAGLVWGSTSFGALSTGGKLIFVALLVEVHLSAGVSDPKIGFGLPRMTLAGFASHRQKAIVRRGWRFLAV